MVSIIPKVFIVFANCQLVISATKIAIYDLNGKIYLLSKDYEKYLKEIFRTRIIHKKETLDTPEVDEICQFLQEKKLGRWLSSSLLKQFTMPSIHYDTPFLITNAIADVTGYNTHIQNFISQLSEMGCPFLQVRFFPSVTESIIMEVSKCIQKEQIMSTQFFIPYNSNESFRNNIKKLISDNARIAEIVVYGTPLEFVINENGNNKFIKYTTDSFDDASFCGQIRKQYFVFSLEFYSESINYNTCLNRKVAISSEGLVKNCPSMNFDYGHIHNRLLKEIVNSKKFQSWWSIKKDDIEVCKDCEFRHACSDCRAFITNPSNPYSKPSKCTYNPY